MSVNVSGAQIRSFRLIFRPKLIFQQTNSAYKTTIFHVLLCVCRRCLFTDLSFSFQRWSRRIFFNLYNDDYKLSIHYLYVKSYLIVCRVDIQRKCNIANIPTVTFSMCVVVVLQADAPSYLRKGGEAFASDAGAPSPAPAPQCRGYSSNIVVTRCIPFHY